MTETDRPELVVTVAEDAQIDDEVSVLEGAREAFAESLGAFLDDYEIELRTPSSEHDDTP